MIEYYMGEYMVMGSQETLPCMNDEPVSESVTELYKHSLDIHD